MSRINFLKTSKLKKQSIATPITVSLIITTVILIIVILISLYYFSSIRLSMLNFSEQAITGIKNSSELNDEVKQLLNDTERLMGSENNPERRIAYTRILSRLEKIKEIRNNKNFNDKNVKTHIEIIQTTLEELNELTKIKINLKGKAWELMEELLISMEGFEELADWENVFRETGSNSVFSEWYIKVVEISKIGGSLFTKRILYDINEAEKEIIDKINELDKLTDNIPLSARSYYRSFAEKQKNILIGESGLLYIIKEKTRVTLLATGRGNFTRTLLKDFIYISSNIFNRIVEYSELQTDKLNRLINSFFIIFAVISTISLFISISVIIFIRKTLLQRIMTLNEEILEKVAGFDIGLTVKGNDEITDMAKSFLYYENEVKKREAELNKIASQDFLTETSNRRHFIELAEKEFMRSRRYKYPITLLMIDIDFFKKINDTYGHQIGDITLKNFSSLCKSMIRKSDIFGRLGGEEFAIILPETDIENGIKFAERLRHAVEETEYNIEKNNLSFTISIGVALSSYSSSDSIDDVMKKADNALYKAKENGRNRVCYE